MSRGGSVRDAPNDQISVHYAVAPELGEPSGNLKRFGDQEIRGMNGFGMRSAQGLLMAFFPDMAPWQRITETCHACLQSCLECFAAMAGHESNNDCPKCCMLCEDMCASMITAVAAKSPFAVETARLCATLCDWCAESCAAHAHEHCLQCAKACRICAEACRAVA